MDRPAYDPYELRGDAIQEPPGSLGQALLKIGPGLILAGSIVGTGELIATTNAGAQAFFALLWLVLLSCFIKVFVQLELGRHAVATGETTLTSFKKLPWPGSLVVWWWFVMMLATQAQMAAMVGSVGQSFHMAVGAPSSRLAELVGLSGRPELPWAILVAIGTALLLAVGSYRLVEKGTTLLVVAFTFMTVACVVLLPWTGHAFGWREIASGLSLRIPPGTFVVAFAMFGITGVGASELISYPYWCIEKGYARNVGPAGREGWLRRATGWLRVMRLDAWVCMLVYTIATVAFYLLGAAVLFDKTQGEGLKNASVESMIRTLAEMYEPVLGEEAALWFVVIGAFAVLYSTLFAATAANSRTLADFLRVQGFIQIRDARDRLWWVRLLCLAFPALYLALFIWWPKPAELVTVGGFAQALTLPMIAIAAIYLRYRRTDPRLTPSRVWDVFLWLSLGVFLIAAAYGLWEQLGKLL